MMQREEHDEVMLRGHDADGDHLGDNNTKHDESLHYNLPNMLEEKLVRVPGPPGATHMFTSSSTADTWSAAATCSTSSRRL